MSGRTVGLAHVHVLTIMRLVHRELGSQRYRPSKPHLVLRDLIRVVGEYHGMREKEILTKPLTPDFIDLVEAACGSGSDDFRQWVVSLVPAPQRGLPMQDVLGKPEGDGWREGPNRNDSVFRKFVGKIREDWNVDAIWREGFDSICGQTGEEEISFAVLCAGFPPSFAKVLDLFQRGVISAGLGLEEIDFPTFYSLSTDAREEHRNQASGELIRSFGRVWEPPTHLLNDAEPENFRRDVDIVKAGEGRHAQLRISHSFPQTIADIDQRLKRGVNGTTDGFDYRYQGDSLKDLLENEFLLSKIQLWSERVREAAIDRFKMTRFSGQLERVEEEGQR